MPATSTGASDAIATERTGTLPSGCSITEQRSARRSHTRTVPDWSPESSSIWFGWSATELTATSGVSPSSAAAAPPRRPRSSSLPGARGGTVAGGGVAAVAPGPADGAAGHAAEGGARHSYVRWQPPERMSQMRTVPSSEPEYIQRAECSKPVATTLVVCPSNVTIGFAFAAFATSKIRTNGLPAAAR